MADVARAIESPDGLFREIDQAGTDPLGLPLGRRRGASGGRYCLADRFRPLPAEPADADRAARGRVNGQPAPEPASLELNLRHRLVDDEFKTRRTLARQAEMEGRAVNLRVAQHTQAVEGRAPRSGGDAVWLPGPELTGHCRVGHRGAVVRSDRPLTPTLLISEIVPAQTGSLGDTGQHARPDFFGAAKREHVLRPAGTREGLVRTR